MNKKREEYLGDFSIEMQSLENVSKVVLVCNRKIHDNLLKMLGIDWESSIATAEPVSDELTKYTIYLNDPEQQISVRHFIEQFPGHYQVNPN